MRKVALATTQMISDWDRGKNVANAIDLFQESTDRGTEIVQTQDFFESPWRGDPDVRWRAKSVAAVRPSARVVDRLQHLARDSFVLALERSRLSVLHGE